MGAWEGCFLFPKFPTGKVGTSMCREEHLSPHAVSYQCIFELASLNYLINSGTEWTQDVAAEHYTKPLNLFFHALQRSLIQICSNRSELVTSLLLNLGNSPAPPELDGIGLLGRKHFTELQLLTPYNTLHPRINKKQTNNTSQTSMASTSQWGKAKREGHNVILQMQEEKTLVNHPEGNPGAEQCWTS